MLATDALRRFFSTTLVGLSLYFGTAHAYQLKCNDSFEVCLKAIDSQLKQAISPEHKSSLTLQKGILMAIFGYYPQSQALLKPLIDDPNLDETESITAAIYLAKIYYLRDFKEQGAELALEAEKRMGRIAANTLDWDLLVEYSNILTYNGKLRESWEVLSALLKRPQEGVPHQVLADMYGMLGHIAAKLDRKQLHLEYRRKSYQHELKVGSPQQLGVAAHNLAGAYAANLDYNRAQTMYEKAIEYSLKADDISAANYSRFRMAELNYNMKLYPVARKILISLLSSDLSHSPLVPPERVKALLEKVQQQMFKTY